MEAKCIGIIVQPGVGVVVHRIAKEVQSGPCGERGQFKNLGKGKGLINQYTGIFLFVEVDEAVFSIPVDNQFRKRFQKSGKTYTRLTKNRLEKIASTMPETIKIMPTGNRLYPYRAEENEINDWFKRL